MTSVLLDRRGSPDVGALLRQLNAGGVGARPLWRPLHLQPVYAGTQTYRVEVAERLYERGLSLPCSVGITDEERLAVSAALAAALGKGGSE